MTSKHLDECQFVLKLIQFSTVSNLSTLEVVQKCQCCQLCLLRENSTTEIQLQSLRDKIVYLTLFMMETSTDSIIFSHNETITTETDESVSSIDGYLVLIIQSSVAGVGIVSNLTVIVAFLNHKKLRRKIPNIFIINQVRRIRMLYTSQI